MRLDNLIKKWIFKIISLINMVIPISSRKIFLYDSTLRKDNLWALCCYLVANNYLSKYKIIYFTNRNNKDIGEHKIQGVNIINGNLRGVFHHMTSMYVFSAFGGYRFISEHKKKQKYINLWHGSPLKTIGLLAEKELWYNYNAVFDFTLCASDFFKDIMQRSFGFTENQAMIMGAPRNDYIFTEKDCIRLLGINKSKYNKIILWMPTFRKSKKNNYIDSDKDFPLLSNQNIKMINENLSKNKILLIIKLHPFQEEQSFLQAEYSNIDIYNNHKFESRGIELYELLGQVNALLTDYSSVYFDFLLTQKPIGFVLDDVEEYNYKRGFSVEDPLRLMPGEKIYNEQDFFRFVEDLANNRDEYKEERKKINDLANKYQDNKNCERILQFLDININDEFNL